MMGREARIRIIGMIRSHEGGGEGKGRSCEERGKGEGRGREGVAEGVHLHIRASDCGLMRLMSG